MEDPKLNVTISRRRFLEGIGTTAAGVTAVVAFGGRLGINAPFLPAGDRAEAHAEALAPAPPSCLPCSLPAPEGRMGAARLGTQGFPHGT